MAASVNNLERLMHKLITACVIAGLVFSGPAAAADAGQAQVLEQQISDMMASLFGPQNRPVQLTPQGDRYQINMPLEPFYERLGIHITGLGNVTGTLAPIDGGRWSIDNLALPSPTHFVIEPVGSRPSGPLTVDLTMHELTSHNVIDPAFATPWTLASSSSGLDMTIAGKDTNQVSHAGPFNVHALLTPIDSDRLDLTEEFDLRGYDSVGKAPDGGTVHTSIAHLGGRLHLDRLDRVRLSRAFTLVQDAKARQTDGKAIPKPEMNALLHQVILVLRDAAGGGGVAETIDDIAFDSASAAFRLAHFAVGIEADAPAGRLGARMNLVIDGPSSPAIPAAALAYLPSHISLRPFVFGIGLAELTQLALDATAPDPQPATDPSVLFAHGDLNAGVDQLELIVGETAIKGTGRMQAASPDQVTGHATLTARNFDALVKTVQKDQVLGPQALPVLLLIRGLAKPDGDNLVWEIAYEGGAITVNGTDLSAITGAPK
jgi:hypothetical protein